MGVDAGDAQPAQLRDRVLDVGAVAILADEHLQLVDDQRVGRAGLVGAGPRKGRAHELLQQQHPDRARQIAQRDMRQRRQHDHARLDCFEQIEARGRLADHVARRFGGQELAEAAE